jgi:hypothetical protein
VYAAASPAEAQERVRLRTTVVEEIANRQEEHLSSADKNPVQKGDR